MLPALVACAVAAALMVLFGRDHPSELGLAAYGETTVATPEPPSGNPVRNAFAVLAEAAGTRVFWILFATFLICGLSTNGLIQTHFIPLCADFGMAEVQAASVLAMMGIFNFVGTVASGWLSDRYDNRKLLFWYYGLRGLSLLWLPSSTFSLYGLSIFAVFYGLDWVATVPPTVKLSGQTFGREKAAMVFGWVFVGHQVGGCDRGLRRGHEPRRPRHLPAGLLPGRRGLPGGGGADPGCAEPAGAGAGAGLTRRALARPRRMPAQRPGPRPRAPGAAPGPGGMGPAGLEPATKPL